MQRWLFYTSLIGLCLIAYLLFSEKQRTRDAQVEAGRLLRQCVEKAMQSQDAIDTNIIQYNVNLTCKEHISNFRSRGCESVSKCEDQIRQRVLRTITDAQKRQIARDRIKQLEKQRSDEIKAAADKLGMSEDQLFDWILKHFKEELLEVLDDDFKMRYAQDDPTIGDD
jgi:vacuolar-type H+-ATPase subunit H